MCVRFVWGSLLAALLVAGCRSAIESNPGSTTPPIRVTEVLVEVDGDAEWVAVSHRDVDHPPAVVGGIEPLRYPAEARRQGVQGTVVLALTVGVDGAVQEARVQRGLGAGLDEEALRVVRATRFEPGLHHGQPAAMRAVLPLRFRLSR